MSLDVIWFLTGSSVVMQVSLVYLGQEHHTQFISNIGKISSGLFSWIEFPTHSAGYIIYLDILHILYHYIDILIFKKIQCLLSRRKVIFLAGVIGASQLFGLGIDEPLIAVKPFPVRLSKNGAVIMSSMDWQCWMCDKCGSPVFVCGKAVLVWWYFKGTTCPSGARVLGGGFLWAHKHLLEALERNKLLKSVFLSWCCSGGCCCEAHNWDSSFQDLFLGQNSAEGSDAPCSCP